MEIVCLRDGPSSVTAYCLPTSTGAINNYFELAKALGPDHSIYGIQLADREQSGKFRLFSSIKEMASSITTELLRRHPVGPICLIGYSFGASLAIESALQLTERGKSVPLVVIIDMAVPSASLSPLFRTKHFI